MTQNSKITLSVESALGHNCPTQQDEVSENQGECFAPLAKRSFVRPRAHQACASMGNLRNYEVMSGDFLQFQGYF